MTRLIDADSIPWFVEGVGDIPVVTKEEIDKMPTVDAVPVIRCRDCKNFHDDWGNKWCYITKWRTNEDRFCSSAEKIED